MPEQHVAAFTFRRHFRGLHLAIAQADVWPIPISLRCQSTCCNHEAVCGALLPVKIYLQYFGDCQPISATIWNPGDKLSLVVAHCHNRHHTFTWENTQLKPRHPAGPARKLLKHGFQTHSRLTIMSTCMLSIEDYAIAHSPHPRVQRANPIHKPIPDMAHVTLNR